MSEQETVVEAEETAGAEEAPVRDYEKEAKEHWNWVPKEEYRGDPERWKPAKEFIEDGERILPLVRAREKKLREELTRKDAEFQERLERNEKANQVAFEALKRRHEEDIERVRRDQRAAVESGDLKEFDRLEKVKDGLEKTAPKIEEAKPAAKVQGEEILGKWTKENPWYVDDFDMRDVATRYSGFLAEKNPSITLEENLRQTRAEMERRFPAKFKTAAANGHAAVDSGGDFSGVFKGKGKTSADLPSDVRSVGERYVREGLFKNLDAYAKEYFGG